jgi:predicted transcriptional regulator
VLASFSGLPDADLDTLAYYTLLPAEKLQPVLRSLAHRGLVADDEQVYTLTEAGQELLMPLMAVAKSNEADMLGAFSADEALRFKQMLKRAISWTGS